MEKPKKHFPALLQGKGKELQFKPDVWEQWNSEACDKDQWKHGRVSELYRIGYENIKWEGNNVHTR